MFNLVVGVGLGWIGAILGLLVCPNFAAIIAALAYGIQHRGEIWPPWDGEEEGP